jgi:hypothetical protein
MLDVLQVAKNLMGTTSPLLMTVFAMGRSEDKGDDNHTLRLDLVRPDGELTTTGPTQNVSLKPAIEFGPGGFNLLRP